MSKQTIWNKLQAFGFSDNACAALMGNWDQESGCEACRLQGDFDSSRTKSQNYATTVNNGGGNFIYDSQGWGLAQWTYYSRKKGLLEYCKSKDKGIEDEEAQVDYAYIELTKEHADVFKTLCSTADLYSMVSIVCTKYEAPAVNNISARYQSAQTILNQYKGTTSTTNTAILQADQSSIVTQEQTLATFTAYVYPKMPALKQGDKGVPVGMMQYALGKKGYSLSTDCDFGSGTANVLRTYQQAAGLSVSGTCDKATWEKLWE